MKNIRLLLGLGALIACTGFGQSDKDAAPQKHHMNYHGKLVDVRGKVSDVDNISISGKLETIKMYEIPLDASHDPAENITVFNLSQIYSIEPAPREKCDISHRFKNREYNEIIVTLNDPEKTQHHYLIDASQKIMCDLVTGAGPLEKQLTFSGIKKLIITGKSERSYNQLCPASSEKSTV
jgi:hypothetical protein